MSPPLVVLREAGCPPTFKPSHHLMGGTDNPLTMAHAIFECHSGRRSINPFL